MSERHSSNISNMTEQRLCHLCGNGNEHRHLSLAANRGGKLLLNLLQKSKSHGSRKRGQKDYGMVKQL